MRFKYWKQIETRLLIHANLVITHQSIIEDAMHPRMRNNEKIFLCVILFMPSFPSSHFLSLLSLSLLFHLAISFCETAGLKMLFTQNTTVNYLCAIRHNTLRKSEAKEGGKEHGIGAERVTCEETQAKLTNSLHDPTE